MKDPIYTPNSLEELDVFAARLSQAMGDVFDMPISYKRQQKLREVMCRTFGYENGLQSLKPFFEQSSGSNTEDSVLIHRLHYGDYIVIARNSVLIDSVDSETSEETYQYISGHLPHTLVNDPNKIVDVTLPEILDEDLDPAEIIYLADILGYFRYRTPLYEALKSASYISFDGMTYPVGGYVGSDFFEDKFRYELEEFDYDFSQGVEKAVVLDSYFASESEAFEFFWSLKDIGDAHPEGSGCWRINAGSDSNETVDIVVHHQEISEPGIVSDDMTLEQENEYADRVVKEIHRRDPEAEINDDFITFAIQDGLSVGQAVESWFM